MPAASYREGPDGHSSRKQNSKRRRAKCSPSFVSGRVIGHGDISPRCIPECSAMALHRAVPAARPSRASTLSFVLLAGAFSKSCLRCRFFAGRAAVIWCGANPGVRPWQDLRECALGRLAVAIFSRDAFSGVYPWQYFATVRSRASIRGNFFASCIPKAASDGKIASSWQDSRAMHPKTGSLWQDMRAMHPKSPANRLSGTHGAKILPGRAPFRCTGPSNHARRANLAKTSSFWIHGGDVLPLRGVISVRGLLENTWRSFIAMVRHCRMHCAPFDSRLARRCSARRQQGTRRWRRGCWGRSGQRQ